MDDDFISHLTSEVINYPCWDDWGELVLVMGALDVTTEWMGPAIIIIFFTFHIELSLISSGQLW